MTNCSYERPEISVVSPELLATAISAERTVDDMANLDLAYAPPFSPAMDLLHDLANVIRVKLEIAQVERSAPGS